MDKFLKVSGCNISYTDIGSGPVIVFLHGWMASKKIYEKVVGLLSKKYRCISIDIPGFGNSGVVSGLTVRQIPQIIHEVIKSLNIRRYYLVGNSLGGALSILYAKRYPKKIIKLVLISPYVNFKQFSKLIYFSIVYVIPYILNKNIISPVFNILFAVLNFSFKKNSGKDISDIKRKKIKRRAVYTFKIAYELSQLDLYSILTKIRKDILLVYGTRDWLLSIKPLEPIFGVVNNIHLAIFENIRHNVFSYNPKDLAKKIDLFFGFDNVK